MRRATATAAVECRKHACKQELQLKVCCVKLALRITALRTDRQTARLDCRLPGWYKTFTVCAYVEAQMKLAKLINSRQQGSKGSQAGCSTSVWRVLSTSLPALALAASLNLLGDNKNCNDSFSSLGIRLPNTILMKSLMHPSQGCIKMQLQSNFCCINLTHLMPRPRTAYQRMLRPLLFPCLFSWVRLSMSVCQCSLYVPPPPTHLKLLSLHFWVQATFA